MWSGLFFVVILLTAGWFLNANKVTIRLRLYVSFFDGNELPRLALALFHQCVLAARGH